MGATSHRALRQRDRGRNRRRIIAALSAFALTATGVVSASSASAADAVVPEQGLLAEYIFDQNTGTSVPNTVSDSFGPAIVNNGADSQWTGSSLALTGGAKSSNGNWVRLPDGLLAGKQSATVTIETKLDATMKNSWNFLWNIGSTSTASYYFASVRDNARTAITTNGGGGEVNARAGSALSANRWYSLTSVIDGGAGTISFYVDGEKVASANTTLTPAAITDQTLSTIGRAPYDDPLYRGEVATFRVYDRALSDAEVSAVSTVDASIHAASFEQDAQSIVDGLADITIDESVTTLPDRGGRVTWSSSDPNLVVGENGLTVTATQPAAGGEPVLSSLTATATVRGATASSDVPVTVLPEASESDSFGYAMVHFIENSAGYAEKIYLDVSRGNDPEYWDPLNGGQPILASNVGTTGVRDPYLTYNPETETYYIIATDLRVFGGNRGSGSCVEWCYWSSQGSTKLNVWSSKDLVTWSDLHQFDVATNVEGQKLAELGMAWAPEATWVDDYYEDGSGAFVLYWSSTVYPTSAHTGSSYSRVMWGATPDFTQETYEYGGVFIDEGGNTIDTTIVQDDGVTYRVTKDNSFGTGLYMESTTADKWWEPAAEWTLLQDRIGAVWANGDAGGVEGPAIFKAHDEDTWYLYVDVIPTTGYRPMISNDLDAGWTQHSNAGFYMAPSTKHGGIVPLTRGQYDTIRAADAVGPDQADLGGIEVAENADVEAVRSALPESTDVTLAYNRGTATQPIDWDLAALDTTVPGTYDVEGTVRTIGANLNQWVGQGGSTAWNAPNKELYSSTAVRVSAQVTVVADASSLDVSASTATRCVARRGVLVVQATNGSEVPVSALIETPYGTKSIASVEPGKTVSAAFSSRRGSDGAGTVTVTVTDEGGDTAEDVVDYAAFSCG